MKSGTQAAEAGILLGSFTHVHVYMIDFTYPVFFPEYFSLKLQYELPVIATKDTFTSCLVPGLTHEAEAKTFYFLFTILFELMRKKKKKKENFL